MTFISTTRAIKTSFLLMLAAPLVFRALYIDSYINLHTDERFFGGVQVLANDAILYAFILSFFYLSFLSKTPRAVAILLRGLAFLAFAVYAIDAAVTASFNSRLTMSDAGEHAPYALKYIVQVSRKRDILILLAAAISIGMSVWILFSRYTISRKPHHLLAVLAVLSLLLASTFTRNDRYINSWLYKNVVSYNLETQSESRRYSDGFISRLDFAPQQSSESKTPQMPNIILLMVESLSSYQSNYFSGLNDWTPNLDQIARRNVAYKSFYANGYCTNDCYVSVLTGRLPIRPPGSSRSGRRATQLEGFGGPGESLPMIFSEKGYTTEFLMAGDLSFSGVGDWAKGLGFDTLEGHDHPFYDGWDRYQFNAAPDEALYARLIEKIKQRTANKYFYYVSTMSTHHPFVNPENGNRSEEETYKYADKQLGAFHEKLIDIGFFDDGILIILGDHHAMVPLKPGETERFGRYRAAARVPLIVSYGNKKQAEISALHQQTDIYNSLNNLVSETLTWSDWSGDIFNHKPAKYVLHRRGDYRNHISVFTKDKDYLIKLDGDDTRVINDDSIDDDIKEAIVDRVNAARVLGRGE